LSASVSGSQLTVGSTTPVISYTFHSGTDENNYSITTNAGALTVTERTDKYAVTLKANAASEEYNGKIQTVSGFEQTTFEVDGQTYTVSGVTATASGKDAGTYDVQISGTPIVTDALGNDVSDQFNVTFDSAQLVISPKEVILTTSDASKQYDGTELSGGQYSWSSRTLGSLKKSAGIGGAASAIVDGDEVTVTFTGSITNITADNLQEDGTGQVENTVVVSGADAGNYAVTYDLGTLTITPKAASISSAALSKEYDGTELKAEDSDYELTGFIEGDEPVITAEESAVLLHAGTTENAFTFSWEDEEFGLNYVVETDFGQMEITPKTVVLRSEDESKTYDGTALENHSVVYDFGAFVQGEEPSFVFGQEASLVSAGTADNTFELVWSEDAGFDQGDYDITVNYGTLEVVPRTVLIVTPDAVKQYDGTPLTNADVTISGDGFVEGEEPVFTAESSKTNVGTAENVVSFTWANEDDEVMLANYDITVENGTLEVLPATLYIITDSALKVEDGEELMADGEIRGVLLGEDIIFTVTGSQSGIGSSTNTYEIDWNGVDPSNYIIKEVLGQLTVVEKEETPEEEETKQPEQSTEQQPQETAEPKKQVQVDTSARTNAGLWTSLSAASLALMELLRRKNKKQ
jgi:hypothetical protein